MRPADPTHGIAPTLYRQQPGDTIHAGFRVKQTIQASACLGFRASVRIMSAPQHEKLTIVHYPDPVLHQVAAPVEQFNGELRQLAEAMVSLMHEAKGVGLAAPQVGRLIRLFVCNITGEPGGDMIVVNPQFSELTGGEEKEEGCLSIPGATVTMRRATRAVMRAFDMDGRPVELIGEGLRARVWQHETDHLNGRLIVDNMSATDEIANRRALRQLRDEFAAPRKPGRAGTRR